LRKYPQRKVWRSRCRLRSAARPRRQRFYLQGDGVRQADWLSTTGRTRWPGPEASSPGVRLLKVKRLALRRRFGAQCRIRLRWRRSGIAESIDDGIAAIAAKVLERHLDTRGRLAALVLGDVQQTLDTHHGIAIETSFNDGCDWFLALDQTLQDR